MCGSMVDIKSPTAEIRRGKQRRRKIEITGQNIMACPIIQTAAIITIRKSWAFDWYQNWWRRMILNSVMALILRTMSS